MGRTPFYRTLIELEHQFLNIDELERVHLLVTELEHPIFGFERSNIVEFRTYLVSYLKNDKKVRTA